MTEYDRRAGLAIGLVLFGILILVGAMLVTVFQEPMSLIFSQAKANTQTSAASTGIGYVEDAWNAAPFIILGLGVVFLLARASRERQFGGGR